jgi:hypothetical protein
MALVPLTQQVVDVAFGGGDTMSLTTARNTRRKVQRFVLDKKLATQIFRMYYEKEPLIDICKTQRYSYVFRGGMQVEWGGGDMKPLTLSAPNEREPMEALFKRVLDYRDMFGMVPVKIRSRGQAKGKPRVFIPPFGSGHFVLEYDPVSLETEVVYEVQLHHVAQQRSSSRGKRGLVKILDVFVWPGYEPSIVTKQFRSKISGLMTHFARIKELRKNLLDADYRTSHPVVFTQARPDTRNLQQFTEEEQFGAPDDPRIMGQDDRRGYNRDVHRARRTEKQAAEMNAISLGLLEEQRVDARETVDDDTGVTLRSQRSSVKAVNLYNLPHGEEMSRGLQVQSRSDLVNIENEYEELVCQAMGTPKSFIHGGIGTRYKGDADQMREIVRSAVMKDRSDINLFYSWAYEMMNRRADDDFIINALIQVDNTEAAVADQGSDERKRIADIRSNLQKVAAMPYRTKVVFAEDPLPKKLLIPNLTTAVTAGALTQLELVNLLRADIGLPTIDQDHELIRGEADNAATAESVIPIVATPGQGQQQQQETRSERKADERVAPAEKKDSSDKQQQKKRKGKEAAKPSGEKEKKKDKDSEPDQKKRRKE